MSFLLWIMRKGNIHQWLLILSSKMVASSEFCFTFSPSYIYSTTLGYSRIVMILFILIFHPFFKWLKINTSSDTPLLRRPIIIVANSRPSSILYLLLSLRKVCTSAESRLGCKAISLLLWFPCDRLDLPDICRTLSNLYGKNPITTNESTLNRMSKPLPYSPSVATTPLSLGLISLIIRPIWASFSAK